jgi:hypothetical protein
MVVLLPMLVLLGLLPFFGGVLLGWEWPIRCLYLACFVLFPGSLALLSWMDYRTIIVAEPQTVSARPEDWTVRATARYEPFLNLPTPRVVRISRKGWLRVSVGAVCLGLALFVFLRQMRGAALPVGAFLLIGGWANLNLVRQRWSHLPIFESGTIVIGRITQQRFQNVWIGTDLIGRYSLVEYEFRDQQGMPVSSAGHDYSKSLFQEMPVLVFHEKEDASRNVALFCSLYEVKTR